MANHKRGRHPFSTCFVANGEASISPHLFSGPPIDTSLHHATRRDTTRGFTSPLVGFSRHLITTPPHSCLSISTRHNEEGSPLLVLSFGKSATLEFLGRCGHQRCAAYF